MRRMALVQLCIEWHDYFWYAQNQNLPNYVSKLANDHVNYTSLQIITPSIEMMQYMHLGLIMLGHWACLDQQACWGDHVGSLHS